MTTNDGRTSTRKRPGTVLGPSLDGHIRPEHLSRFRILLVQITLSTAYLIGHMAEGVAVLWRATSSEGAPIGLWLPRRIPEGHTF